MHIIFGKETADGLRDKYTVLELDQIQIQDQGPILDSFCVLDTDAIRLEEIGILPNLINLHAKLMENYRKRDWNFCEQAIEHLHGRWGGTLNTFYDEISQRIAKYKQQDPGPDWNGVYEKFSSDR